MRVSPRSHRLQLAKIFRASLALRDSEDIEFDGHAGKSLQRSNQDVNAFRWIQTSEENHAKRIRLAFFVANRPLNFQAGRVVKSLARNSYLVLATPLRQQ